MLALELSGIFLGVLARAFSLWVRKLRDGEVAHFSKRYLYSAIGSVIAGMIVTVLIFPKFSVPSMAQGAEAGVRLFAMAFGFGFGWHAIVDEVGKWSGVLRETERRSSLGTTKNYDSETVRYLSHITHYRSRLCR